MLFLHKPYRWAKIFTIILIFSFGAVLLDAFVIPKVYAVVESPIIESTITSPLEIDSFLEKVDENKEVEIKEIEIKDEVNIITENSYSDNNITINIEKVTEYNTNFYIADIQISDSSYLKTALANNTYVRNIKETTSQMAEENNAILAINGDYYGFRDEGYVLRNGVLYRNNGSGDSLIIDSNKRKI